jgi:hypothetical protein
MRRDSASSKADKRGIGVNLPIPLAPRAKSPRFPDQPSKSVPCAHSVRIRDGAGAGAARISSLHDPSAASRRRGAGPEPRRGRRAARSNRTSPRRRRRRLTRAGSSRTPRSARRPGRPAFASVIARERSTRSMIAPLGSAKTSHGRKNAAVSSETWIGSRVRRTARRGKPVLPIPSPRFDDAVDVQRRQKTGPSSTEPFWRQRPARFGVLATRGVEPSLTLFRALPYTQSRRNHSGLRSFR